MVYHVTYPCNPESNGFIYVASDEAGIPGVYDIDGRLLWDTWKCMGATLEEWIADALHHGAVGVKIS